MSNRSFDRSRFSENGVLQHGFIISCGKCGEVDYVRSQPHHRSDNPALVRKFQRAGWSVGQTAGADRCPDCAATSVKPASPPLRSAPEVLPMAKPTADPMPSAPPTLPTPAASEKIAEVYMQLVTAYDGVNRCYRAGWSDDRIAREIGVAVGLVAARRESDFGPVIVDSFAADLGADVEALAGSLALVVKTAEGLATAAAALTRAGTQLTQQVERLRQRAAEARERAP